MAVCILLFVVLGLYLDKVLGLRGVAISICSLLGIVSGGVCAWKLLARAFDNEE